MVFNNTVPTLKYSLSRWGSLFACGAVAAALWKLIEPAALTFLAPIADRISQLDPVICLVLFSTLALAGIWPLSKDRWDAFWGIKHFWSYPPLWVAMVIGMVIYILASIFDSSSHFHVADVYIPILAVCGSIIILVFYIPLVFPYKYSINVGDKTIHKPSSIEDIHSDFTKFKEWFGSDDEVKDPVEDHFDHANIARRIADRLTKYKEPPTVAVVGPLGSGKSTLGNFVSSYVKESDKCIFVRFSLWPFDTPEAAVRGVLKQIVNTLGEHVNIISIGGIERDYLDAIARASGRFGGLFNLVRSEWRPDIILERLAQVTKAIDHRLIIWIEDLERFSGTELTLINADNESAIQRESQRLGALRALFHLLDRKPSIAIVIADNSLDTRYDTTKIARFVERMPVLSQEMIFRDIKTFRDKCLNGYPITIIDSATEGQRNTLIPESLDLISYLAILHERNNLLNPVAALAILIQTPRILKSSLRLTDDIWNTLRGEIDFDDCLCCSVLRVSRPSLFSFIDRHLGIFRNGFSPPNLGNDNNSKHPAYQEFQTILDKEDRVTKNAINTLVNYLFPKCRESNHQAIKYRPQGVAYYGDIDYWERYLSVPDLSVNDRDQLALQSIHDWRLKKPTDLVTRILDPNRCLNIIHFYAEFDSNELCRLLMEVAEKQLDIQDSFDTTDEAVRPGIPIVVRIMEEITPPQNELYKTLLGLVHRYIGVSLPLIHELDHYIITRDAEVRWTLGNSLIDNFWQEVHKALVSTFVPNGAAQLLDANHNNNSHTIYWLSWGLWNLRRHYDEGEPLDDVPFTAWAEFSNVLLNACEIDPIRGIPLIIPFITDHERDTQTGRRESSQRDHFILNAENARALFTNNYSKLKRILSNSKADLSWDKEIQKRFSIAKESIST